MDSIGSYLAHEHMRCAALLVPARAAARHGRWGQARCAVAEFRHALERHLLIEERITFPAYEQMLGRAIPLTAASRAAHLRIRAQVQRLADALQAGDAETFLAHADTLEAMQCQHGEEEETVLYPMIERVLARRSHDVLGAMRAFGALDALADAA